VKFKLIFSAVAAIGLFAFMPPAAVAQEGEPVVVDEVIAQVNDGVVTLSLVKRELKEQMDELMHRGMSQSQAAEEVQKHKAELIATLINEQLLMQKGKELELSDKVEAEVNKRMLDAAKENHITNMLDLEKAMRDAGLDPVAVRQTMRAEIMKQAVIETEVDSKIFYGLNPDELHRYFDAHRDKFRKPEVVDLSEIFLNLAGKPEAAVKARADQLVTQLRNGADFKTVATASSERQGDFHIGLLPVPELRPDIAAAIKNVKAGGVSDPLKTDEGYEIIHVDARTPGSDASVFNENQVREAVTGERAPKAREDYLQSLRDDAYIKLSKDYEDSVRPLLKLKQEIIVEKTGDDSGRKPEKKKGKIFGILPKP
jgi:peptidyl-prolyl cis-trans isomerase SurA